MPSDDQDQTSPQADRLSRKLDRLQTGQPSPVHDGDTEDLADLARLLMEHLDKGQPDPEFRSQLMQDLINPSPRLVAFRPRSGPRRYPVPALFSALTVVLVASAVTGWMAFGADRGASEAAFNQVTRFATATPAATSASGALISSGAAVTLDPTTTRNRSSAAETDGAAASDSAASADAMTSRQVDAAAQSATPGRAVVDVPPLDANHVELGALATVVSPSSDPPAEVSYSQGVDPASVVLDRKGVAYQFSSPYVQPDMILRSVQEFLGIEAQIDKRERGGKTVYALTSVEGSISFTWSPESGAFTCTLPNPYSTGDIENLTEAALAWLDEFGFPVSSSDVQPVLQTNENGQRFIHVPLGDSQLPNPAYGHPMTITLVLDSEDRIVSVSGYWLEVTDQTDVSLVTAEQAWQRVQEGGGYWPPASAPREAGEFVAEQFEVSYMLTSASSSKHNLTLQPVIAVSGSFYPEDGSASYSTTVYVQGLLEL